MTATLRHAPSAHSACMSCEEYEAAGVDAALALYGGVIYAPSDMRAGFPAVLATQVAGMVGAVGITCAIALVAGWPSFTAMSVVGAVGWVVGSLVGVVHAVLRKRPFPVSMGLHVCVGVIVGLTGAADIGAFHKLSGPHRELAWIALTLSSGLGVSLALAAALPELPYACGLNTVPLLAADLAMEPLTAVDGAIKLGDLTVDQHALDRHRPGLQVQRFWQARLVQTRRLAGG